MKSKIAAGGDCGCSAKDGKYQSQDNNRVGGKREQVLKIIRKQQHSITDYECEIRKDLEQFPS